MSFLPTIVLVDDEERILRSLRMLFRGRAEVLCTTRGADVVEWVGKRKVHVVVSDQRMPEMTGIEVLREVARVSPATMRILLTGYADMDAVIASVNEGEIFRFLEKPWNGEKLVAAVMRAAEIAASSLERPLIAPAPAAPPIALPSRKVAHALVLDAQGGVANLVRQIMPESIRVSVAPEIGMALDELVTHDVAVIVAVMSSEAGDIVDAIKQLKKLRPATLVIAVSSMQDSRLTISLINEGQIFRFLLAPPGRELLRRCLASALERHAQLRLSPVLAERHEVEESRSSQVTLSGRLLDVWRRLREGATRA
ncbi:MAG: response regulator [Dokdonella sp.]|nr:response regulator [Dokdonella sp.]MCB1570172.1 response regulator [Xanthomonadales bacterium]MCB1577368.1 response regulator [Xanthomonadales bacterium]